MQKFIKKNYKKHKEKIHNFFWRAAQIFGKQGFSFLSFIIFISFLTPYDYGVYGYIMSSIFFLTIFADFGISGAVAKYVAEYNETNKKKLKLLFFNSAVLVFIVTVFLSLITIFFGKNFFGENYIYVIYTLPILFFAPLVGVYSGIYTGLKKFKSLAIKSLSCGAIALIINYVIVKQYGLLGALIGQNIFYLILLIVLAFGYKDFTWKYDKKSTIPVIKYAAIIGVTTLSYYFYSRADIVILGKFGYITEIAYYNVVNKVFELAILPFAIYAQISGPSMTALYVKKKYLDVKKDFTKHVIILFIFGVLIAAAAYFIVPIIIKMFFQKYFNDATLYIFSLLIFILPLRIIASYVGGAHTGPTGNAHFSLWPMIIAGIANVLLDILFISKFGFIGVVYSTLICYSFAIITFSFFYYRKLRRLTHEKI